MADGGGEGKGDVLGKTDVELAEDRAAAAAALAAKRKPVSDYLELFEQGRKRGKFTRRFFELEEGRLSWYDTGQKNKRLGSVVIGAVVTAVESEPGKTGDVSGREIHLHFVKPQTAREISTLRVRARTAENAALWDKEFRANLRPEEVSKAYERLPMLDDRVGHGGTADPWAGHGGGAERRASMQRAGAIALEAAKNPNSPTAVIAANGEKPKLEWDGTGAMPKALGGTMISRLDTRTAMYLVLILGLTGLGCCIAGSFLPSWVMLRSADAA